MVSWLGDRESVDGVGLLGHSKGAEYALLAASQYEAVDAVVVIAPSAYAFAPPGPAPEASSWTIDGEEVYPLPREASGRPPREQGKLKLAPMARTDIEAASQSTRDEAAIPVENISGDVLLIGGGDDGVWPVGLMMDHLVSRLDRKGFDHEVERLFYEQAGQVITIPYKPTTAQHYGGDIWAGGTPRAAAMAEADA